VSKFKNLSAIVFFIPAVLMVADRVFACPVSSAYRYVLLDHKPAEIPDGAIVLEVEAKNLEEGHFGKTGHISTLKVKRVEGGRFDQSTVDLVVAPFTSCTRGNETATATFLIGFIHKNDEQKPFFFPIQYIGRVHRQEGMGDLDRAFIPEEKYVSRAFRAMKAASNNE
jgi:hypothetical protein